MTTRAERIAALDRATPIVLSIIDQWLGLTQPRQSPDAGEPWRAAQ